MSILGVIGWMLLGGSLGALWFLREKETMSSARQAADDKRTSMPGQASDGAPWCSALEEALDAGVIALDASLHLRSVGRRAQATFGISAGCHLVDAVEAEELTAFLEGIAMARREGKTSWRCRWRRRDGKAIAVAMRDGVMVAFQCS